MERKEGAIELLRFLGKDHKICLCPAGKISKNLGTSILSKIGIQADFFCDKDIKKHGQEITKGVICKDYDEAIKEFSDIVWIICANDVATKELSKKLYSCDQKNVFIWHELLDDEELLSKYWDFLNIRTAAYTCIVDHYDNVKEPSDLLKEVYDFFLISDTQPSEGSCFKWINIRNVLPEEMDNTRSARYCKINAHKLFPDYKRSVYFDGNIRLEKNMDAFFDSLKVTRLGITCPCTWDSAYAEAVKQMEARRDWPDLFYHQLKKYWTEGFPNHFGSWTTNILVREHNHPICKKLMEEWWHEVKTETCRDQISLPYVLWKNGFTFDDVLTLSEEWHDSDYWSYVFEHSKDRRVVQ